MIIKKNPTIKTVDYEVEAKKLKRKVDGLYKITSSAKEEVKMLIDEMSKNLIKYTEEIEIPGFLGGNK